MSRIKSKEKQGARVPRLMHMGCKHCINLCANISLFESLKSIPNENFDAVVLTVSHNKFKELDFLSLKKENAIIYDVKNFLDEKLVDGSL